MKGWLDDYGAGYLRLTQKAGSALSDYDIPSELSISTGWAGYSVQQYVAKVSGGKLRPVAAYDKYKAEIPARAAVLDQIQVPGLKNKDVGVIPNMFSMVPLAQNAHAPIADMTPADGVRGAQVKQQARYVSQLNEVFARLAGNLGYTA
jgi:hypothetical protein